MFPSGFECDRGGHYVFGWTICRGRLRTAQINEQSFTQGFPKAVLKVVNEGLGRGRSEYKTWEKEVSKVRINADSFGILDFDSPV